MTHVTCGLTAKNRDQLRNPTLGNRVWATFTFLVTADSFTGRVNEKGNAIGRVDAFVCFYSFSFELTNRRR